MTCAPIRRSSSPAASCPTPAGIYVRNPTLSRLENAPGLKDVIRPTYALVDQWMASYAFAPPSVRLDIDDTCDVAPGHQQLSLFNAHYDERCFRISARRAHPERALNRGACAPARQVPSLKRVRKVPSSGGEKAQE